MRREGELQGAGPERGEQGQALWFRMGARTQEVELRRGMGEDRAVSLWGEYVSHKPFSPSVMVTWALADGWPTEQMTWSLDYLCNTRKPQ